MGCESGMGALLFVVLLVSSPLDRAPPPQTVPAYPRRAVPRWQAPRQQRWQTRPSGQQQPEQTGRWQPRPSGQQSSEQTRRWQSPPSGQPMVVRCPRAYVGVIADLLPSGWRTDPGRSRARLVDAQVRGGWLDCQYRISGGQPLDSVERQVPYGYTCHTSARGVFRCVVGDRRRLR